MHNLIKRYKEHRALFLALYTIAALMVPCIILAVTEEYTTWSMLAGIIFPAGMYTGFVALTRRTGVMTFLSIGFAVVSAFQIVVLGLFGKSVIASDMFQNVFTTNFNESTELLNNLLAPVALVVLIYLPMLTAGIYQAHYRFRISPATQKRMFCISLLSMIAGLIVLIPAKRDDDESVFLNEIFPVNAIYNFYLCLDTRAKILTYNSRSAQFEFEAVRSTQVEGKEIYLLMIGEASRAFSWQMWGYSRETNPELSQRDDIMLFRNCITQSNTTHKSVPLILSSVSAPTYSEFYKRKSIFEAFNEAGFQTYFISNQPRQNGMIDLLASQANETIYIGKPHMDELLLRNLDRIVKTSTHDKMFFVLHCYGSHTAYHQRYPREFAHFMPDTDVQLKIENKTELMNAYDNTIVYTDHVINSVISYLKEIDECSAFMYISDHGEDILDDYRCRTLHASPTITAYQIHVPCMLWMSDRYSESFPGKRENAQGNQWVPATTHSAFHTMLDMAAISSPYWEQNESLLSPEFDTLRPRYYLNDHCKAVEFDEKIGLEPCDKEVLKAYGLEKL